ncbi:MAG: hypothetical protein Fur0037_23700 [Planctomycetota bacterium]
MPEPSPNPHATGREGDDRPRGPRAGRRLCAGGRIEAVQLAVVFLATLLDVLGLFLIEKHAAESDRVASACRELRHQVALLNRAEWEAIGLGYVDEKTRAEAAACRERIEALLETLGFPEETEAALSAWLDAVDVEFFAVEEGMLEEAVVFDSIVVDPAFDAAVAVLERAHARSRDEAVRRRSFARGASIALLFSASLFSAFVIQRLGRARVRAAKAEVGNEVLSRANRRLREARRVAEEQGEAKIRFVATMSHEIRTPLNGILGMAELLQMTPLEQEASQYASTILDCANSLMAILDNVLDFSKMESGAIEIEDAPFRPREVVEQILLLYRPAAGKKGLSLGSRIGADVPRALSGDRARLAQILRNLVSNAVKFTEEGFVEIEASVLRREGDRVLVRFAVRDSGIGIDEAARGAIFEPFRQAEASTTRRFGGTGLGLSISRGLAKLMGGSIDCESASGRGSEFRVDLPFGVPADAAREDRGARTGREGDARSLPAGLRVLVAEDNPVNQRIAKALLEKWDCRVALAGNGLEAVELSGEQRFDLILMDCQMPELDGLSATARIREREKASGRRVPIVALTADGTSEDRERCLKAGMDGHLAKPFRKAQLAEILASFAVPNGPAPGDGGTPQPGPR